MANADEIRWQQRLQHLERAFTQLDRACGKESYSELELAGLVQMFEFTFELAWKTMKDLLFYEGYDVNSPREVIRKAFETGLIQEVDLWLEILESRNRLSHTYDEQTALEAEELIKDSYTPMIRNALESLRQRLGKG